MSGWGIAAQAAGELIGKGLDFWSSERAMDAQKDMAREQMALQKDFAQQGIRWRVEDAQKAGIHPLYAMGAQVSSYSPVYVGESQPVNFSESFSRIGQDISRSIDATRTAEERQTARLNALAVDRAELENDYLRAQIRKLEPSQVGPALPGYGPSNGLGLGVPSPVEVKPLELNASDPGNPAKEAGYVTDYGFTRTPTGLAIVPSKDVKDRIEDQFVPELMWAVRNSLTPNWSNQQKPDPTVFDSHDGRPVVDWKWSYTKQEWQPVYYSDTWKRIEGR